MKEAQHSRPFVLLGCLPYLRPSQLLLFLLCLLPSNRLDGGYPVCLEDSFPAPLHPALGPGDFLPLASLGQASGRHATVL